MVLDHGQDDAIKPIVNLCTTVGMTDQWRAFAGLVPLRGLGPADQRNTELNPSPPPNCSHFLPTALTSSRHALATEGALAVP